MRAARSSATPPNGPRAPQDCRGTGVGITRTRRLPATPAAGGPRSHRHRGSVPPGSPGRHSPKAATRHSGRRTPGARIGPPRSPSESGRLAPTPRRSRASSEPPPGQELQAGRRPGTAGELAGGARIRSLATLYKASISLVVLHIWLMSTLVYKTVVFIIETVINIHKHTLSRHHTKAFKLITDPDAFQLLGDETRRRIIYLLRAKEMTVSQIAGELNLTPQAIYHHIRKLRDAGMVEVAREEGVDHLAKLLMMSDKEFNEYLNLIREERKLLRSLKESPEKVEVAARKA